MNFKTINCLFLGTQFLIQKLPNDQDGNYNFPGQENRVSRQPHPETVYLKPLGEDNCQSQTVGVASSRIREWFIKQQITKAKPYNFFDAFWW